MVIIMVKFFGIKCVVILMVGNVGGVIVVYVV